MPEHLIFDLFSKLTTNSPESIKFEVKLMSNTKPIADQLIDEYPILVHNDCII